MLAGAVEGDVLWTEEGHAVVLRANGEPFLQVEPTDARGQAGIRVVRLGEGHARRPLAANPLS